MTLIEVLFTMAIMAIGMVSVASLFPVAAKLQDDAANEIIAEQASRNAEAIIKARGVRVSTIGDDPAAHVPTATWNVNTPGANYADNDPFSWNTAIGPITTPLTAPLLALRDRSYPSSMYNSTLALTTAHCDFFWVPVVRDADPRLGRSEPQCAVFVMHRASVSPAAAPGTATITPTSDDPVSGVPVAIVTTNTLSGGTLPSSGLDNGDLVLYGSTPAAASHARWNDNGTAPTLTTSGLQWEVQPCTTHGNPGYRSNPANYTTGGFFGPNTYYAQAYSASKAVTYRVTIVSGDLLLQK